MSASADRQPLIRRGLFVNPIVHKIQELGDASDTSPVNASGGAPTVEAPVTDSLDKGDDCCVGRMP